MRQVCILVEGQTEEAVVKTLLIDAAKARDIYLIPIIMRTPLTPAGASRKVIPGVSQVISGGRYGDGPLPWGIMGV